MHGLLSGECPLSRRFQGCLPVGILGGLRFHYVVMMGVYSSHVLRIFGFSGQDNWDWCGCVDVVSSVGVFGVVFSKRQWVRVCGIGLRRCLVFVWVQWLQVCWPGWFILVVSFLCSL